jgi:hypothetical protein
MSQSRTTTLAKSVQDAVVAYLKSRSEFIGVPILGRRRRNIVSDIREQVDKAGGACIYVFPALPLKLNSNTGGPHVDVLLQRIRAIENPSLNEKLPDAYELAELLIIAMDGVQLTSVTSLQPFYWPDVPLDPQVETDTNVQFDVLLHSSAGLTPRAD